MKKDKTVYDIPAWLFASALFVLVLLVLGFAVHGILLMFGLASVFFFGFMFFWWKNHIIISVLDLMLAVYWLYIAIDLII